MFRPVSSEISKSWVPLCTSWKQFKNLGTAGNRVPREFENLGTGYGIQDTKKGKIGTRKSQTTISRQKIMLSERCLTEFLGSQDRCTGKEAFYA